MPHEVTIEQAVAATDDLTIAVARLLPLLSSAPAPTAAELGELIAHDATTLFVARAGDDIVGICSLVTFPIPSGVRAWIEDVIVDEAARGAGVASELVLAAIAKARSLGARSVDLTSRPSREAANRLYQRLGFVRRETNVYRIDVRGPEDSNARL